MTDLHSAPPLFATNGAVEDEMRAQARQGTVIYGRSYWGQSLTVKPLGVGGTGILVCGSFGGDASCGQVASLFYKELSQMAAENGTLFRLSARALLEARSLHFIPCPNPDALSVKTGALAADSPFYPSVTSMLGRLPRSLWCANGRGVDPLRNFNHCFAEYKSRCSCRAAPFGYCGAYPESEPESAAFARLARSVKPRLLIHLTKGRNGLCYEKERHALHALCCRYAPFELVESELSATPEGWIKEELGTAYVRIGSTEEDAFRLYTLLRPLLFALCAY